MKKQEIRKKIKALRAVMDPADVKAFSDAIKGRLLSLESVTGAGCIMSFYSYENEPQMIEFMHKCIDMGKKIVLPCVTGQGKMIAVNYNSDSIMKNNVYGIPEPVMKNNKQVQPDTVIVPGIAFDLALNRIGFGGGYYDRFLEGTEAYKIGVCFDYQIIERIESESHDVPMDLIVTEKRIIGEI